LDISPDNMYLVIAHNNGPVVFWDLTTKRPAKTINIHTSTPLHVKFMNDSRTVLSADNSGQVFCTVFKPQVLFGYSANSGVY